MQVHRIRHDRIGADPYDMGANEETTRTPREGHPGKKNSSIMEKYQTFCP
jgi:hypothetical protein